MSGQDFVRAARGSDAAGVARIQVECWRTDYAGVIPDEVLAELTSAEAAGRWQERWAEAIAKPPTSRHHVLIATATEPTAGGGRPERVVAGFASAGPASDEDRWPATDAAKPGAFVGRLRGEKRLEDPRENPRFDARAGVADRQPHPMGRLHLGVPFHERRVGIHRFQFD